MTRYLRLAGLIAVICIPGLAGSDWGVINKLQEVFSVSGDDGKLLTVFAKSIELVGESCLEFLTSDVGKLSFCNKRLGFGSNQLLLQDNDAGAVGLFVLELGDLISDFLLAFAPNVSYNRRGQMVLHIRSLLGCTEASMFRMLLIVTRY